MARKRKVEVSEDQLALIDVDPENAQSIIEAANKYKASQSKRLKALEAEVADKQTLLSLIKDAKVQRLEDGRTKFRVGGMVITVTPRDELIRISEQSPEKK